MVFLLILKWLGVAMGLYLLIWAVQYIWGMIGFVVLLKASGEGVYDFVTKVVDWSLRKETKWLLLKWPVVLYRMKKGRKLED